MPVNVIKGSLKYCLENKWFFGFVIILFFTIEFLTEIVNTLFSYLGSVIFIIITTGYGIQIIQDIINGGTRLPKIMPKKAIVLGVKGFIIRAVYFMVQLFLLVLISASLNFPTFRLKEFFINYNEAIHLMLTHNMVDFAIFVISGFAISYVTIFFMEFSLARLADGGQLRKSFNFPRVKHAIDVIGWKRYTISYSKIILAVLVLLSINKFFDPYRGVNIIVGTFTWVMSFVVEFRGMGNIYKVYTDSKKESGD